MSWRNERQALLQARIKGIRYCSPHFPTTSVYIFILLLLPGHSMNSPLPRMFTFLLYQKFVFADIVLKSPVILEVILVNSITCQHCMYWSSLWPY